MSWFTDLAGRAENILNKIDQNAATVLQQQQHSTSTKFDEDQVVVEIKSDTQTGSQIKRTNNSMSLSSKKMSLRVDRENEIMDNDNITTDDKNGSNSMSRRSSSSRADEGTVIEVPQMSVSSSLLSTMKGTVGFEQELAAMKIVLAEVKSERDDLKNELEAALIHLKNTNKQSLIEELEEKCELIIGDKVALEEKIDTLERSNLNYVKSISDLELKLSKSHQSESDLTSKLDWAKRETEQAVNELQQYRSRAQSTLLMKDKIIEKLKGNDSTEDATVSVNRVNLFEIENLKTENSNLSEEVRIQNEQLEQIRGYVDKLENVQRSQEKEFDRRVNALNGNLRLEETKWMHIENESKAQMKELTAVKDEMKRLKIEYADKIHEKESELNQLRSKLAQRSSSPHLSFGLEERVHSLTQSLVQKQTSLETITADRNALRIQLEKLETQHRNTMIQLRQQRPQIINVNDTDDAKAQVPNFLQENPFDTNVTRRVKRAYSNLDSVGIRLGVFLRRYPLIRILAIFYVALLHLWVIFVLVTSTPST